MFIETRAGVQELTRAFEAWGESARGQGFREELQRVLAYLGVEDADV